MTERPILFSGPMVRAILAGQKTQTRRVVKHPEAAIGYDVSETTDGGWAFLVAGDQGWGVTVRCPYGILGDRLWVRETWGVEFYDDRTVYAADHPRAAVRGVKEGPRVERWRPSIHMPRWASRLTLEVVSVQVERLQEISEEDAKAEGVTMEDIPPDFIASGGHDGSTHRGAFGLLWDSINGKRASWESNPWVWVVEFKRVP